ncbi:predicted protein [Chaetoceros tenuissimus]|uniref:UBA domain-containing protein n=1 Tax=Chaetoceros tenuissimus TaxID=426638 RepID=A0AAD3CK43_9STRA|nr:predicted protein [Chaetoceros tenuissimus]
MKFSVAILASLLSSSAEAFTTHPASLSSMSSPSPFSSALHLSEYNMGYSRRGEDVNAMSMQQLKSIVNRMGFDERGHDRAALVMIAKGYPDAVRAVPLNGYRDRHEMYDRGYERFGSDYNSRGVGMDYRGNVRYQDRSAPTRMYEEYDRRDRYYDDRRPPEFYDEYDDDEDLYFENDYRTGKNGPPVQRRERMERRDMGPSRDLASNRGPMEQNVVGRRAPPPPPPPMDDRRMDDRQREPPMEPPMERKEPSMNTMPGMDPKERELFERELARQKRGQRTGPANFGGDAPGFNPVPGSSGKTNAPPSTSPTSSNTNTSSERRNENPRKDLEQMTYGELQQAVQKMGFDPKNHDQAALQMILKGYPEAVNARPLNGPGDNRDDDFYLRDDRYLDEEYYASRGSPRSPRGGRPERGGPGGERRPIDPRSLSNGDMRGNGRGDMRGDSRGMRGRSNGDRRGGREFYDERDMRERRPNGNDNYGPRPRGGGDRGYDERFYNGGYDDFRRGGGPRGAPPPGYYGDNRRGGY